MTPRPYPKIDANPTKKFFISMLVRDIQLLEAIVDLVDNSIDSARRLRAHVNGKTARYGGLHIQLTLGKSEFRVVDNCGGIDAKHAKDYAFNFGRKDDFPAVEGSVGEFGVGMKRALFKMGKHFTIQSQSERSRFTVDVNVLNWASGTEIPWEFEFKEYSPSLRSTIPEGDRITEIAIDDLYDGVAEQMALGRFHNEVSLKLGEQHQASLDQGLEITVNGKTVTRQRPLLLESTAIQSAHKVFDIPSGNGKSPVRAELFAGLAESGEQNLAGWYIYCNDRLVVNADKSSLTGWGRTGGGTLPSYHPQYRRFRGYAFLTSEEIGLLPWNTTKTSVDPNSPVYRRLLREMIPIMQEVLTVIAEVDDELDSFPRRSGPLNKAIDQATPVALGKIAKRERFLINVRRSRTAKSKLINVQYKVDRDKMETVKESLNVGTAGQAGVSTFEYYYSSEIE